jgi:hypothetical protein
VGVSSHDALTSVRIVEACPGNGTRYVLALTPIHGPGAKVLGCAEGAVLVSLWPGMRNSASCVLTPGGYFAAYYLAEKLHVNDADAQALSDILHRELSGGAFAGMADESMHETTGDAL